LPVTYQPPQRRLIGVEGLVISLSSCDTMLPSGPASTELSMKRGTPPPDIEYESWHRRQRDVSCSNRSGSSSFCENSKNTGPSLGSIAAISIVELPGTKPTYTSSLKNSMRGFSGVMKRCLRLVLENTSSCDAGSISNASSRLSRNPRPSASYSSQSPSAPRCCISVENASVVAT